MRFVGFPAEADGGRWRLYLAENAHHFVEIDPADVVENVPAESTGLASAREITVRGGTLAKEGWLDDDGFEGLSYDDRAHSGRLSAAVFTRAKQPESWFHPTGYDACHTRLYCIAEA